MRTNHPESTIARTLGIALAIATLAAHPASPATAQTVYRCGNTYSQTPCADPAGAARPVDVADPRTPEQTKAAREAAARDNQAVQTLQREREARERREREAEAARQRAAAAAAAQAQAAERAALAEQQRRESSREVIVIPRKTPAASPTSPSSPAGPKPFTAVAPAPAKPASAKP